MPLILSVEDTPLDWQRATLESLEEAVITTDLHGRIVFMNPAAEQLTGWKPAEALNRHVEEVLHLLHEETGEVIENLARKAMRCTRTTVLAEPTALIDRDDRVRPVKASAKAIRDAAGRPLGAALVFHDITEQRQSEQRLKALNKMLERHLRKRTAELEQRTAELSACEQRLSMALETSQAGYYEHARSLESGYVCQRWADLLGYRLDELPPLPALLPWWESRLHGQDQQRVRQAYCRFMQGDSGHFDIEYRIKHRRDGWRWQRMVSRRVQAAPAAPGGVVAGLVLDITERKHAERRLLKLDRALERCIAQRQSERRNPAQRPK